MGRGGHLDNNNRQIDWEEVQKHDKRHDKWIVVDGGVYNITEWANRHPGGRRVISHFAGQDATVS